MSPKKTGTSEPSAGKVTPRAARTSRKMPAPPKGPRAWLTTANMGLGHQRAAYPLRDIAEGGIITLGKAENTSPSEQRLWERLRKSY